MNVCLVCSLTKKHGRVNLVGNVVKSASQIVLMFVCCVRIQMLFF